MFRIAGRCATSVVSKNVRSYKKYPMAIKWKLVDEGMVEAKRTKKPLMMCIYRNSCPASKILMPKLISDPEIIALSSKFVMVECDKDKANPEYKFSPDGSYLPRYI